MSTRDLQTGLQGIADGVAQEPDRILTMRVAAGQLKVPSATETVNTDQRLSCRPYSSEEVSRGHLTI